MYTGIYTRQKHVVLSLQKSSIECSCDLSFDDSMHTVLMCWWVSYHVTGPTG